MGAAYSTTADAPVSAAPSLPGTEIGTHVLNALRVMMDPNSALKEDSGNETKLDENRQSHSSCMNKEEPQRVEEEKEEDRSNTIGNGKSTDSMHFAVDMDIIALSDEIEVGPVHGGSPSRKTGGQVEQREQPSLEKNKKVKRSEEEAVDVYMSLVAPTGLVKALSSSSVVPNYNNIEKQITSGEQAV